MTEKTKATKFCTCLRYCKGGSTVHPSTYKRHRPYREATAVRNFTPEFGAFLATHPQNIDGNEHEDTSDVPSTNVTPRIRASSVVSSGSIEQPYEESIGDQAINMPQGMDRAQCEQLSDPQANQATDPGSIASDESNIDHGNEPGEGSDLDLVNLIESAQLTDIQIALQFIELLRTASFDNDLCKLDADTLERLKHPVTTPVELSPDERLSLDLFVSVQNASQEVYNSAAKAIRRRHPDDELLSYYGAKHLIAEITGVTPVTHDMCVNSCIAYTGPFNNLDLCPKCGTSRRDPQTNKARQTLNTIPLGPQLQALKRHKDSAVALQYRVERTHGILEELEATGGRLPAYDDFLHGSDYLNAVRAGLIREDDIVIMLSIDGAQLYAYKQSDCWVCIWVVLDHSPDTRYKMLAVLPAFVIPGPNKPKVMDSFLFPSLYHLSALQKDGFPLWDGSKHKVVTCYPFFALGTADGPAMTHLNGLVGHMGKNGCRMYCGVSGRRKDKESHYYPALLKPLNYRVAGCDHPDVDPLKVVQADTPAVDAYERNLQIIVGSTSERAWKANRLSTGVVKPSIFLGIDSKHRFPIPRCFGTDIMHHATLNIPDLMIPLWRGTFDCDGTDSRSNWDWAVLTGPTWTKHGKAVSDATPYLPGSFDRPPRNPALKISSGYKAWEFLLYLYGLGPGLFYKVLPDKYYQNYCDLVHGIRIVNQYSISRQQLLDATQSLVRFVQDFEEMYYQRREGRLHFIRQSIHQLLHLPSDVVRVGPPVASSQWTMERTIGNLTQELRQPSNPYANLSERSLIRCQVNALKVIVPELKEPNWLPRGSIDLGSGYILLRRKDGAARPMRPCEENAVLSYLQGELGLSVSSVGPVVRWARLRLPNGQVARSLWKEKSQAFNHIRMARNVKVWLNISFFDLYLSSQCFRLFTLEQQPLPRSNSISGFRSTRKL
jgi:hypothetical protein